jgi:hypothetical protein
VSKITYEVVEHDGGWAYRVGSVYSEAFPSHDEALTAAKKAAAEQRRPDETVHISWEDENGSWHEELALGNDRPDTEVRD